MKKTLAAVLAAMMALSTATVAMAADTHSNTVKLPDAATGNADSVADPAALSFDTNYDLFPTLTPKAWKDTDLYLDNGNLYTLMDNGWVKAAVTVTEGRSKFATVPAIATVSQDIDDDDVKEDVVRLRFKVAHTYGTSGVDVGFRARFTATKNIYWSAENGLTTDSTKGDLIWTKGDTYVSSDFEATVKYTEISHYDTEMTITEDEVKAGASLVDASDIYDITEDTESVIFYFDDAAAWEGKIPTSQKDFNAYFSTAINEDIAGAYDDVDFEFVDFKGTPSFVRSGVLTFNAIGDEDTVVYEVTDDGLVELESEYDSTYGIVTVEGVKTLTSYAIASEALEIEVEEPVVEEPAVEEENPNTGAC